MGYLLSWRGQVSAQEDPFDERGMFSEVVQTDEKIHLQDHKKTQNKRKEYIESANRVEWIINDVLEFVNENKEFQILIKIE